MMNPHQSTLTATSAPFNFTNSSSRSNATSTAQLSAYDLNNPRLSISLAASKDSYYANNELSIRIDQETRRSSSAHRQSLRPSEGGDESNDQNYCSDKTWKCIRGVILTVLIATSWVGFLHLIRVCSILNLVGTDQISSSGLNSVNSNLPSDYEGGGTLNSPANAPRNAIDFTTESIHENEEETGAINISSSDVRLTWTNGINDGFNAPFFMAWYCSTWNILFLPIFSIIKIFSCCFTKEKSSLRNILVESLNHLMNQEITPLQFVYRCSFFCFTWLLTNYLIVYTITRLDVTVVMTLFTCTITLVYLFSWVFLHHQFVGMRIVAVIICDTGVALLAYMNGTDPRTIGTVALVVAAALAASIYKVFYQRMIGYGSYGEMSLFFTLIGLLNIFLIWPILLLLYFTGSELFALETIPWLPLSLAAGFNLTANLLSYIGTHWTYEVFLSFGLLLAIPISAVVDATLYNVVFKEMKLGGVLLIVFGTLVVLLPDNWSENLSEFMNTHVTKWKRKQTVKGKNGIRIQDTSTAQLSRLRTPSGRVK